jgi:hypothetical protein
MPVVTTGQITIVDQNDAKPITAFVGSNTSVQQIFNPDTSPQYTPDYTSTNLILTAYVYAGSTSNIAADNTQFTNRKWSLNDPNGASLGSSATLTISTNQASNAVPSTYYFQGTYVDTVTGLATTVITSIQLSLVRTGTNATFVQVTGQNIITESPTATKNNAYMVATLYRGSSEDTTQLTYNWFKLVGTNWQKIFTGNTNVNAVIDSTTYTAPQQYGFKLQSAYVTTPNTPPNIGDNMPTSNTDDAVSDTTYRRGIAISERAVNDVQLFKVAIKDETNTVYENTFVILDAADPYELVIVSTAGDKFVNAVGNTTLYPRVFYGATKISTQAGWVFTYRYRDKDGNIGGLIDTTKTVTATGYNIASNTTTAFVLSPTATNANFAANAVIKAVKGTSAKFFEIASVTQTGTTPNITYTLNIRTSGFTTSISNYTPITANEFQLGSLFICNDVVNKNGDAIDGPATTASIVVTQYDIDSKGTIFCEGNAPG